MKKIAISVQFGWLRIVILGLILFVLGAVVGVAVSFPNNLLEQRLIALAEQQGQISIEKGRVQLGFINLNGTNLEIRTRQDAMPPIEVEHVTISPLWGSLFSGNPGAHVEARLFSGQLQADLFRDGLVDASARDLRLDLPLQNAWNLNFLGQVQNASFNSVVPLTNASESQLQLVLGQASIRESGKNEDMLDLGRVDIKATGKGQSFRITTLTAENGDFTVSGRGNLRLGNSPATSAISLRLDIRPAAEADQGLVELLKLAAKENAEGNYELRISGNLASPSFR